MESGRWAGRVSIGKRKRGGVESGGKKIDGNLRSFIKLDVEAHSYHEGCLYQRGLISLKACLILRWECVCVCGGGLACFSCITALTEKAIKE